MPYSTLADIEELLPEAKLTELTDDTGSGTTPDTSMVAEAIATADAEIDGYCARFTLPWSPVPNLIKKLSIDIAIYNIYSRKPERMPDVRQVRYENAVRILTDIAKGLVDPTGGDPLVTDANDLTRNSRTEDDRTFTRSPSTRFMRDTLGNY